MARTFGEQSSYEKGVNGGSLTGAETHSERKEFERGVNYRNGITSPSENTSDDNSYSSPIIDADESNSSNGISSFEVGMQLHTLVVKYGAKTIRGKIGALLILSEAFIGAMLVPFSLSLIIPLPGTFWIISGFAFLVGYIYFFRKQTVNTKMAYAGPIAILLSVVISNLIISEASLFDLFSVNGIRLIIGFVMMCVFALVSIRIHLWFVNDRNETSKPEE